MWRKLALTFAVALPAVALRLAGVHLPPLLAILIFGAGVVTTAVILSWAAEAAQVDISSAAAIAILAVVAVLPEYAVDLYFAYTAGSHPEYTQFAAANMTGSNRLLLGIGWPLVTFVGIWALRRRRATPDETRAIAPRPTAIELASNSRVELGFLAIASVYAFVIPLTRAIAWYDAVILLVLFGLYLLRVSREQRAEPELLGVAADLADLPTRQRRPVVAGMFVAAAAIVVMSAEPFANGLVEGGRQLGIDQFLLVQWLAPLSSEAPEMIVATLFALRLRAEDGLGILLSAKVNQWTLLVGSLWIAYTLGGGSGPIVLDDRQTEEFLLTATQALLGVAVLLDLRLGMREAAILFGLFILQFPFPQTEVRLAFSGLYVAIAVVLIATRRAELGPTFRAVLRRPSDPAAPAAELT
jgi:cation:H+ antiporter